MRSFHPLFRWGSLAGVIGLLGLCLISPAHAQDSESIKLGTTNTSTPAGSLTQIEQDTGATTPGTLSGTNYRSTVPPDGQSGYIYFKAGQGYVTPPGSVSDLYVTVTYLDKGTDTFQLEFDATNPDTNGGDPANDDPDADIHRVAGTVGVPNVITKGDTGKFQSHVFHLFQVYFGGREEGGADFRIDDKGDGAESIASVVVSKTNPIHLNLPLVSSPPKLDGVLDEAYWKTTDNLVKLCENALDVCQGGCVTNADGSSTKWSGPDDYCAELHFAWDNNALYIANDVVDDVPRNNDEACGAEYAGDGVEVFWSFDATNPGRNSQIDGSDFHWYISAPPAGMDPTWAYETIGGTQVLPNGDCTTGGNAKVFDRTDGKKGYIMEIQIPWSEWKSSAGVSHAPPTANQLILFSMFGNDGDVDMPAANGITYDQEIAMSYNAIQGPSGHPSAWVPIQLGGATPVAVKGDLNGDGKVNIADATMALQFAVGNGTPTAAQITAGDVVGGDGKIGIPDVTKILQAAIGAITL